MCLGYVWNEITYVLGDMYSGVWGCRFLAVASSAARNRGPGYTHVPTTGHARFRVNMRRAWGAGGWEETVRQGIDRRGRQSRNVLGLTRVKSGRENQPVAHDPDNTGRESRVFLLDLAASFFFFPWPGRVGSLVQNKDTGISSIRFRVLVGLLVDLGCRELAWQEGGWKSAAIGPVDKEMLVLGMHNQQDVAARQREEKEVHLLRHLPGCESVLEAHAGT
ncbi:hypothetical protein F4823DRAFT_345149 [Ustulina deusta]|nr:hypothetical protein F4823DRAFT_345149 [Ustulina deusta]